MSCGAGSLAVGTMIGVLSTTAVCPAVRVVEPTITAGTLVLLPEMTVGITVGTTATLVEPTGMFWTGCEDSSAPPGTCTDVSEAGGKTVPTTVDGSGTAGDCPTSEVSPVPGTFTVVSDAGGRSALISVGGGAGPSGGWAGSEV